MISSPSKSRQQLREIKRLEIKSANKLEKIEAKVADEINILLKEFFQKIN